ncbi:MAG: tRNA pseudouridine(55) synthase TruB, partial [Desulfobacterales bacterium]
STCDTEKLADITENQVRETVAGFLGAQAQVAPAYSALKHEGQPLYKLARQGEMIQKPPRQIEIHKIGMSGFRLSAEGYPVFDMDVQCSGGTYIRSLAFDIGQALGCGAHLSALTRTRSSQFTMNQAVNFEALKRMAPSDISDRMIPMSQCLAFMPLIVADDAVAKKIRFGQPLRCEDTGPISKDEIRIIDREDNLLAIVQADKSGQTYKYCCVFNA